MDKSDYLSLDFLAGGGEMGERIRSFDWTDTPLGDPETWSQALRATVAIMLNNSFPMLLWWTKDYISIYNDAYIPVLGAKHPWGLGLPVRECWQEIWHILQPLIDTPFNGGDPTWMDDIQLVIQRNNYDEETHFIISYSPIPDPLMPNGIGGVLATVTETTDQVMGRRALATHSRVSAEIAKAKSEKSVYEKVALALSENKKDFPFCIIYKIDDTGETARCYATGGFEQSHFEFISLNEVDLNNSFTDPMNVASAIAQDSFVYLAFDKSWAKLPKGEWDVAPRELVHIPLKTADREVPQAVLTVGLNPYRRFNEQYRELIQLVSDQISIGLTNVLAKERVERSEQHLREIIAQAPVAMCILTGKEHVIEVANRSIVELWGKPESEVMNKPIFDALPDARGQGLEEVMKAVYETGEAFYASEMPVSLIRHGQQDVVYQDFVYQPYFKADGHIAGVIAVTIDVTEQVLARKKLEQNEAELRQTQQKLEKELEISREIQRQKDDFIGMASHELKTPLTSLTAMLQVAQNKLKNSSEPFLPQAMDKANIQVKKMSAMIKGFLDISRLEANKLVIEKQPFDINLLIAEVVDEIKLTANNHQLCFQQYGSIEIWADRDKIGSVISNLINNAVKYSPKGQLIDVKCATDEQLVIVSIKDEGMGIKPHDIDKIFDRYYRVESKHTNHIAGFGIGLYLSAEIVKRHNGRIWAESESGRGSTFYFSLPRV